MNQKRKIINVVETASQNVIKDTQKIIFRTLGFEQERLLSDPIAKNKFLSFVEEQISDFEIIRQMKKFFNELKETIEEEFKNVNSINEDLKTIEDRLNNKFQSLLRKSMIYPETDFKYLAQRSVRMFPTISFEQINSLLKSKKGQISNMLNDTYRNSINSMVQTIPHLALSIKEYNIIKNNIDRITTYGKLKIEEVQKKYYGTDSKYIRESIRLASQFTKFQKEIQYGVYNTLLKRPMSDLECEQFVEKHIPGLKEALAKEITPSEEEYPPPISTTIKQPIENKPGMTEREVELENFTDYLLKEILEELNLFDISVLNKYDFVLKEQFIVEVAVERLGYLSPEEAKKISTHLNNKVQNYLNNMAENKPKSY